MNLKEQILKSEVSVPEHVAVIMDGNRRWAKGKMLPVSLGHREGVKRVMDIVESSVNIGVKALTVYAFSTENWGRDKQEVDCLMGLMIEFMRKEIKKIHDNNIKLTLIGHIEDLPENVREEVQNALDLTKNNTRFYLNIALSYGSRDEIIRAVKSIVDDVENNKISKEDITEESFKKYLYTKDFKDPDLLIRTSGEIRLSNFLLYQLSYTEFYFTDILWPEFKEDEYYKAILEYQNRNRRYGKQ